MRLFDEFCPKFFAASRRDFSIKISLAIYIAINRNGPAGKRKNKGVDRKADRPAALVGRKAGQAAEERYRDANVTLPADFQKVTVR